MPNLSNQFLFVINTGTSLTSTSASIPFYATPGNTGPFVSTTFSSLKEKGDGYFGSGDGFHTVTYTVEPMFTGSIAIEASLASEPTTDDWFEVVGTSASYTSGQPGLSLTNYLNFVGNFVWIRARVVKSSGSAGGIQVINYNR
jgi:hypothetical protein